MGWLPASACPCDPWKDNPESARLSGLFWIIIEASRDPVASRRFDDLIKEAQIIIEPATELQARIARDAYRHFGKAAAILPS